MRKDAEAAEDVVAEVAVTRAHVSLAKEDARDVVADPSSTIATSQPYELEVPALAALTKVNVKCLSHFQHAFRCE